MDEVDRSLLPAWQAMRAHLGPLELFDTHTHVGQNDPDGYRQTPSELLERLGEVGARGLVFPMQEPDGYASANDAVLEAVAGSNGMLAALCRVDPRAGAVAEATRSLDNGAAGIKLHPRAERFGMSEPAVADLVALAAERRAPVLIHAGRGIPALGRDTVALAERHPEARLILAHAGISDLAWMWRRINELENIFVDTSWWNPADLLAVFALLSPSRVLWASDSPYGHPLSSVVLHLRCALQGGVGADGLRLLAGAQIAHLVAGEDPEGLHLPAAGPQSVSLDPHLDRIATHTISAFGNEVGGGNPTEQIELARLACDVDGGPHTAICAAADELLELALHRTPSPEDGPRFSKVARILVAAMTLVRTPDVDFEPATVDAAHAELQADEAGSPNRSVSAD